MEGRRLRRGKKGILVIVLTALLGGIFGLEGPLIYAAQTAPLTKLSALPVYPRATAGSGALVEYAKESMQEALAANATESVSSIEVEIYALSDDAAWVEVTGFYDKNLLNWRKLGERDALESNEVALAIWRRQAGDQVSGLGMFYVVQPAAKQLLGDGKPVLIVLLLNGTATGNGIP